MGRFTDLLALVLALAFGATANAQTYPTRAVRIVVPAAAGGGLDVLFRAIGRELSTRWSQPVVIDNRPGASGIVGTSEVVTRGGRDGYTLLAATDDVVITNRLVYRTIPYDVDKDLTGVAMVARADQLLIAHHSLAANDVRELVALARAQGSQISFGAWGDGSAPQLVYGMLNVLAGTDITQINYKGVAPVLAAIAGNEIQLSVVSGGTAGPLIRAGKVKLLAAASRERFIDYPGVATTAEQGYPQLQSAILFGLMAPAGTPGPVIEKISIDVRAILDDAAFAERNVTGKGWRLTSGGPREFAAAMNAQAPVIAAMVKAAKIQPQ